jgi:GntR family transcriptional regulator, transcriptional repressor for pyruvate dehydrogenase complex
MFKEIKSKNLSREIVNQVIDSIKNNSLKVGDRIPSEIELTNIFKVSRGTIREAMKSLENFGLIEIKKGKGTFVTNINIDFFLKKLMPFLVVSKEELIKFLDIRILLEVYGIEEAVKNANERDIELIEAELSESKKEFDHMKNKDKDFEESYRNYIEHDINFHILIGESTKNTILSKLLESVRLVYFEQQIRGVKNVSFLPEKGYLAHKKILEAIKNKDIEKAKSEMRKHIESTKSAIY